MEVKIKCCVPGCRTKYIIVHRFPNPRKRLALYQEWLYRIPGANLWKLSPVKVYTCKRVCRGHFEQKYFSPGSHRLHINAVPTLHLDGHSDTKPVIDVGQTDVHCFSAEPQLIEMDHTYCRPAVAASTEEDIKPLIMLPGIGVFGTGSLVRVLVPILKENGFKIEALWSRTVQEAQEIAKELDIPFFTNKIDDVLLRKDVDLIFVLCAPNLHAQISVKALGIGKHVVCDKPAGLSQSDALKMVRAGQYYPTLISLINHSFRFLPAFTHMRRFIQENYLASNITLIDIRIQSGRFFGDSDNYDWRCDDVMGGGTLNLIGSHVIDLVTFLTGRKAARVHGVVRTFTKTTENICGIRHISAPDFCTFQMELEGGTLVTATLNSHTACSTFQQEVTVCSNSAYLIVRGGDLFGRRNKSNEEVLYLDVEDLQCAVPNLTLPRPLIKGLCKMVGALREAFLPVKEKAGWIKEPVCLAAGFEDGLYVQAVLSAIRQSSQTLQWVRVDVMTEQPDTNALLSAAVRRTAISIS